MNITLPLSGTNPWYYDTHIKYFRSLLDFLTIKYELSGKAEHCFFQCKIGDKIIVFDFADRKEVYGNQLEECDLYFKYHYTNIATQFDKILPFTPVSFYDWAEYFNLSKEIEYKCNTNLVLCNQRPYGDALKRRTHVQGILQNSVDVDNYEYLQQDFWKLLNNCLVSVHVPGAREDILDRGQIQMMAFGGCTISPLLSDHLPWYRPLTPGYHYVQCSLDYSNLIEKINWCKSNRAKCVEIGNNAKKLFLATSTPERLWLWIKSAYASL